MRSQDHQHHGDTAPFSTVELCQDPPEVHFLDWVVTSGRSEAKFYFRSGVSLGTLLRMVGWEGFRLLSDYVDAPGTLASCRLVVPKVARDEPDLLEFYRTNFCYQRDAYQKAVQQVAAYLRGDRRLIHARYAANMMLPMAVEVRFALSNNLVGWQCFVRRLRQDDTPDSAELLPIMLKALREPWPDFLREVA